MTVLKFRHVTNNGIYLGGFRHKKPRTTAISSYRPTESVISFDRHRLLDRVL